MWFALMLHFLELIHFTAITNPLNCTDIALLWKPKTTFMKPFIAQIASDIYLIWIFWYLTLTYFRSLFNWRSESLVVLDFCSIVKDWRFVRILVWFSFYIFLECHHFTVPIESFRFDISECICLKDLLFAEEVSVYVYLSGGSKPLHFNCMCVLWLSCDRFELSYCWIWSCRFMLLDVYKNKVIQFVQILADYDFLECLRSLRLHPRNQLVFLQLLLRL